ncbi:radical SAM protein [Corallincola spongiicola]|uniref:Radical SAM protein n=1 Tax=Corallincola spongiicola TaxID=2520508 RepID=A0ABY1WTR9_9GAMM|nr:radical SAM protein [Corallincola spongiicola]TAA47917.1 radical SAM protein [Corallincola spongiicola]
MKPLLEYPIENGRIVTRSLEAHIVDHCNLKCAECCSLSPMLPARCVTPAQVKADLEAALKVVAPTYLKLVGGEPLLHPQLMECIEVARPLANILSVTTNALLIEKMPDRFWQLLDGLTISIYPKPKLPPTTLAFIKRKAAEFDVELNLKEQSNFVQMTRWQAPATEDETRDVFAGCWLRERCHIVDQGRFYMCTRPPHFDSFNGGNTKYLDDGVVLDERPTLVTEVHQYLTREQPLATCYRCLGGFADEKPHRQMNRAELIALGEISL